MALDLGDQLLDERALALREHHGVEEQSLREERELGAPLEEVAERAGIRFADLGEDVEHEGRRREEERILGHPRERVAQVPGRVLERARAHVDLVLLRDGEAPERVGRDPGVGLRGLGPEAEAAVAALVREDVGHGLGDDRIEILGQIGVVIAGEIAEQEQRHEPAHQLLGAAVGYCTSCSSPLLRPTSAVEERLTSSPPTSSRIAARSPSFSPLALVVSP